MAKPKQTGNKSVFPQDYEVKFGVIRGIGNWNYLTDVDDYGKYSTKLTPADNEKNNEFFASLEDYLKEAKSFVESKGLPVDEVAPILNTNDDGEEFITPKRSGNGAMPKLYDIHANEVTGDVSEPFGGSDLKVKVLVKPYYMPRQKKGKVEIPSILGLSYKLLSAQIIKDARGGRGGESDFTDESGGDYTNEAENADY